MPSLYSPGLVEELLDAFEELLPYYHYFTALCGGVSGAGCFETHFVNRWKHSYFKIRNWLR